MKDKCFFKNVLFDIYRQNFRSLFENFLLHIKYIFKNQQIYPHHHPLWRHYVSVNIANVVKHQLILFLFLFTSL